MLFSTHLLSEFQELHHQTFGEPILPEEAEMELLSLAELIRITYPSAFTKDNTGEKYGI